MSELGGPFPEVGERLSAMPVGALRAVIERIEYPAWLLDAEGSVVFFNAAELGDVALAPRMGERLWRQIKGNATQCDVVVSNSLGRQQDILVDAMMHDVGGYSKEGATGWTLLVISLSGQCGPRDRSLIAALLSLFAVSPEESALAQLTPQQRKIYRLLGRRLSYKEIASRMGLGHATIRVQIANIRKTLGDKLVPVLRRK